MKISHYYLRIVGLLIFITVVLNSCDDYLSVNPKGSVDSKILGNEQGAKGLLMSAYSLLNGCGTTGGSIWTSKSIHSTLASDDAMMRGLGDLVGFMAYNLDSSHPRVNQRWEFLYSAIQRSNDVLRLLGREDVDIPESVAQQIRAEAIFLRGVYHLETIMYFGNIPYLDESISFTNGNYLVSNESSAWPHIEDDFQFAADNLTETKPEPGNANKWAAKSYLAKTYMFQAKFTEAKPLLEDIIANGVTSNGQKYDLHDEYHHNFDFEYKNGPEAVFPIQMSVFPSSANGNCADLGNGPFGGEAVAFSWTPPSFDMADAFRTDETTGLPLIETYQENPIKTDQGVSTGEEFTPEQGSLDPRIDWTIGRRGIPLLDYGVHPGEGWKRVPVQDGPYATIKHINWNSRPEGRNGIITDTPYNLIRFADVLLWAAEVEVEIGSLTQAEVYVNRIRERAANPNGFVKKYLDPSDPQGGFSDEPAANYFIGLYNGDFEQNGQDWAREAVRFERRIELGMEHHRFFDLQRYDIVTDGYMAEILNRFLARLEEVPMFEQPYMGGAEFTKDKNEIYPIPLDQIDLSVDPETGDPTLIQNPGY